MPQKPPAFPNPRAVRKLTVPVTYASPPTICEVITESRFGIGLARLEPWYDDEAEIHVVAVVDLAFLIDAPFMALRDWSYIKVLAKWLPKAKRYDVYLVLGSNDGSYDVSELELRETGFPDHPSLLFAEFAQLLRDRCRLR